MFFAEGTLTSEQAQTYRTAGVITLLGNSVPGSLSQNATNMLLNQGQIEAALRKCLKLDLVNTLLVACVAAAVLALNACRKALEPKAAVGIIRCLAFLSIPFFGVASAALCMVTIALFTRSAFKACGMAFYVALKGCLSVMGLDYLNCITEEIVGY